MSGVHPAVRAAARLRWTEENLGHEAGLGGLPGRERAQPGHHRWDFDRKDGDVFGRFEAWDIYIYIHVI